jgi:hypothetical protein
MKKKLSLMAIFLKRYIDTYLFFLTFIISISAFLYFYFNGQQNLANYDAIARLNTARKIVDSITPGVGQLGGIWLPFPQALMIPFVWNDFLWYSGIAGYIISGASFVVGAVFLQKTVYLLTKKLAVSLLVWFIFVSNVNILLLQTMAMSEVFFMSCLILVCYFLALWIKKHDLLHFLLAALFVMILTLIRYEGYFVLAASFLVILIELIRTLKSEGREKVEGMLLLYLTVAGFGIILWCIYSALFYKDPLFWLHAYSQTSVSVIQGENAVVDKVYGNLNPSLFESLWTYLAVMFVTNGMITVTLGLFGILHYVHSFFKKSLGKEELLMFLPVGIISIVTLVFLVIGYYIGFIPHIEFPPILLTGENAREWSVYADSNIRYGMVLFPLLLLFIAFIASRNKSILIITILLLAFQSIITLQKPQMLQYSFVESWRYPQRSESAWFKNNYDGGLVLISTARHEDFIFRSGIPYKSFIYEGSRNYWHDSLKDPTKHAKWVVYNDRISGDGVTLYMTKEGYETMLKNFQLVYEHKGLKIYKRT